jgi:hypothetical protein
MHRTRNLEVPGGFYAGWFCDEHTGASFNRRIFEEMADLRMALELFIYVPDNQK